MAIGLMEGEGMAPWQAEGMWRVLEVMSELSADSLLEYLFDGVYAVDTKRRITYWNEGAERLTGFSRKEVVDSFCADNILRHIDFDGNELCTHGCPLALTLVDGKIREDTVLAHHKSGHRVPVQVRVMPITDDAGRIVGAVEIFNDNCAIVQMYDEVERLKQELYLDQLTGVANRRYGEIVLDSSLFDRRSHALPVGILFIDIDRFKRINDTYGHLTGDDVLVMVARSVANVLRKGDLVARWGGEEFLVVLPGAARCELAAVGERIRAVVEQSFLMIDSCRLAVTVSVGGAAAEEADTAQSLLERADRQMYLSKEGGRNRVTIG